MQPSVYQILSAVVGAMLLAMTSTPSAHADDCGPPSSASSCICIAPRFEGVAIGSVGFQDDGTAVVRITRVLLSGTGTGFSQNALIVPDTWNEPIRRLGQTAILIDFLPDDVTGARNLLGTIVPSTGTVTELLPLSRSCKTPLEMDQLAEFLATTTDCNRDFYLEFNIDPRSACDTSSCGGGASSFVPLLCVALLLSWQVFRRRTFGWRAQWGVAEEGPEG